MLRAIFTCAASILLSVTSHAELKWEQTAVDLHPALGEKQAIGHFKYENVGNTTIRFKSIKPSCGCTTAQTNVERVAPGEKGEITAAFHIGDRTGVQVKTVTVKTDDPDAGVATTVLRLKATIPELLEVRPALVYWQRGESLGPKIITVRTTKDFPAKSIKVICSNPAFQARVKKAGEGQFKIEVQPPAEAAKQSSATLTIQSENSSRNYYATAKTAGSG
ncbi:MAG TPA: DUF1573 domain-containing protein [Chthoniobacterales bacterium]|nr:DUF1573 domain-containing protein [Chthoniobacterales bacterium]